MSAAQAIVVIRNALIMIFPARGCGNASNIAQGKRLHNVYRQSIWDGAIAFLEEGNTEVMNDGERFSLVALTRTKADRNLCPHPTPFAASYSLAHTAFPSPHHTPLPTHCTFSKTTLPCPQTTALTTPYTRAQTLHTYLHLTPLLYNFAHTLHPLLTP